MTPPEINDEELEEPLDPWEDFETYEEPKFECDPVSSKLLSIIGPMAVMLAAFLLGGIVYVILQFIKIALTRRNSTIFTDFDGFNVFFILAGIYTAFWAFKAMHTPHEPRE